jgi:hypothetical protein
MKTVTLTHYVSIFHVWTSFSLHYQEIVPMTVEVMVFEVGGAVKQMEITGYG